MAQERLRRRTEPLRSVHDDCQRAPHRRQRRLQLHEPPLAKRMCHRMARQAPDAEPRCDGALDCLVAAELEFDLDATELGSEPAVGGLACPRSLLADDPGRRLELPERRSAPCEPVAGRGAVTLLPGLLVARCLASEALLARGWLIDLWRLLRPAVLGREAISPRIWST